MVRLRIVPISLLASNTRALLAAAVPLVISSIFSKSASLITALPIVRLVAHVIVPITFKLPALDRLIFSEAASLEAVLNDNLVALLSVAKSPSETASIPAATRIASVPVPSSGAWKLIVPITSSAAISVSPVWSVRTTVLLSAVFVFFIVNPVSATWVSVISLSAPNLRSTPSVNNDKSPTLSIFILVNDCALLSSAVLNRILVGIFTAEPVGFPSTSKWNCAPIPALDVLYAPLPLNEKILSPFCKIP